MRGGARHGAALQRRRSWLVLGPSTSVINSLVATSALICIGVITSYNNKQTTCLLVLWATFRAARDNFSESRTKDIDMAIGQPFVGEVLYLFYLDNCVLWTSEDKTGLFQQQRISQYAVKSIPNNSLKHYYSLSRCAIHL